MKPEKSMTTPVLVLVSAIIVAFCCFCLAVLPSVARAEEGEPRTAWVVDFDLEHGIIVIMDEDFYFWDAAMGEYSAYRGQEVELTLFETEQCKASFDGIIVSINPHEKR